MRKISLLSMLLLMALFSLPACAPTVSQQEYDQLKGQLSALQSQLVLLQGKLVEFETLRAQNEELSKQYDTAKSQLETIQANYEQLSTEHEQLSKQYDTVKSQFETIQVKYEELGAEYEELSQQFDELSQQYHLLTEGTVEINEADVEQAVFRLINQERSNNGLAELIWGPNLYGWARANSLNMAKNKRLEYSDYPSWQEIHWAAGYWSADKTAEATLIIWQNTRKYEDNFLNIRAIYGAVGAYKSGEVFHITYIASNFP